MVLVGGAAGPQRRAQRSTIAASTVNHRGDRDRHRNRGTARPPCDHVRSCCREPDYEAGTVRNGGSVRCRSCHGASFTAECSTRSARLPVSQHADSPRQADPVVDGLAAGHRPPQGRPSTEVRTSLRGESPTTASREPGARSDEDRSRTELHRRRASGSPTIGDGDAPVRWMQRDPEHPTAGQVAASPDAVAHRGAVSMRPRYGDGPPVASNLDLGRVLGEWGAGINQRFVC